MKQLLGRLFGKVTGSADAEKNVQRSLEIDALEPRVLFSGAPVEAPDAGTDAPQAQTAGATEEGQVGDSTGSDQTKPALTEETLGELAREAASRWEATGLTPEQSAALSAIEYELRDLGGLTVAFAEGNKIVVDDNAGGLDWFLDTTPGDDAEFEATSDSRLTGVRDGANADVDLLTVLMHEQGHILGLSDRYLAGSENDLMYGGAEEGVRRLPVAGQAASAVPGSLSHRAPATLTVDTFNDVVDGGDGLLSLREAINQAVDGDTIVLSAGTYSIQITGSNENANANLDFDISGKILTIQGAGKDVTFVNGQQLDRVFHVTGGANVTFKDLTITGGKLNHFHGAGMLVDGTTTVVHLENVKIDGNTIETPNTANVDRFGGGMRVNNSTVTGINVDITNNIATRVGAGRSPLGAGIMLDGVASVTFTDSNISNNINNHSLGGGAYVGFDATLTLEGVTMSGNSSDINGGGAIFGTVGSTINLVNSATTQTVIGGNDGNNGGAIRVDGAILNITGDTVMGDILIQNNAADAGVGGGLYLRAESQVTMDRVTISGNTASTDGGGLYIESLGTVVSGTRVTISGNTATNNGGGFRVGTPGAVVTLTDSVVSNNTVTNDYGGGIYNNGTINLINTDIEANITLNLDFAVSGDAAGRGAGFFNGPAAVINFDSNSDVRGNHGAGDGAGGFNEGGIINANGNTWENNFIDGTTTRNGGGLWNYLGGVANLDSVTFQNNATNYNATAVIQGSGGAIYNSDQAILNITGATVIQGNLAAAGAGIANASNGSVVNITGTALTNVLIQDNWARADGGGLRNGNELSAFNLSYVTIQNNIAETSDGGGIANQNGILRGDYVTIHNNAAGYADGHDGGGIYAVNRSDIIFTNSVISNNAAGDDGGGVFVATVPVQVVFENSVITGNKTGIDHRTGTTYVDGANTPGNITVLGDVTTASSSTHTAADGGGIYGAERANITLINSSVTDNIAGGVGGGIGVEDDSQLSISGSLISGNMAGFKHDGASVSTGQKHGGGIYTRERVQLTLEGSVIKENVTNGQGGGLYQIEDSTVSISGSTFESNIAGREGGGYYQTSTNSRSNVSNSTFTGNQAGVFTDPDYAYVLYDTETTGNVATDLAVGQTITTATGSGVIIYRAQNTNSTTSGTLLLSNVTGSFTNNQLLDNGVVGNTALVNGTFPQDLGDGGGVYLGGGVMNLIHTTVTGNTGTDAGGGVRRAGGSLNFLNSVASNNTGRTVALSDLDGTIAATTSYEGAATLTSATGATVGASLAGGSGTTTVQDTVTIFTPDSGDTNIVGAVTAELLASDQNGGGRGGSAAPSDLGAIELNPLTSAITLDSVTVPATWISGNAIEVSAVASSSGTGGGDLRISWSVSGGTSAVIPVDHDVTSPGLDEEDSFSFTHTISSVETSSETLTVTVTITDLTTGQTVSSSRDVRVINPDAMPTTPVGTIEVTTATDVIDAGDGLTSLREAITAANASAAGDYVITFAAGLDTTSIITTISGTADDGNAREDYDITKSNGAVFIKGNGMANTIIDGGGLDRVFDIRPNATGFFSDLTITGGVTVDVDHGAGFRAVGSTVVLNNVDVSGNQSTRGETNIGGGFYVTNNGIVGGTVVMNGGSIRENVSGGHGGGFYASGSLASTTAVFMEGVTIAGNASINEGTTVDRDGGGFYFTGQKNVLQLKDVTIADNAARDDGGGFFFAGEYNTATFDNVTIQRNVVEGAAQDNDDSTSFNAVSFHDATNSGRDGGGGIIESTNSSVTFIGGLIGGDRAAQESIEYDAGTVAFTIGQTVTGGTSGATAVIDDIVVINGTTGVLILSSVAGTFQNNEALTDGAGGAAVADGTVQHRIGDGNYADNNGAGIYVRGASTVTFDGTTIRGNFAEDSGGGVAVDGPSTVTFNGGTITDNFSIDEQGGGVAIFSGTFNATGTSITNNRAGDRIYNADPGDRVGGGFYITGGGMVNLEDITLTGNTAEGRGGAIYADRASVVNIISSTPGTKTSILSGNSTVENSTSRGGAAVWITHAGTTLNVTDATIENNRSADDGGAIFLQGASTANLERVDLIANEAQNQGGALFLESDQATANLVDVTISGNATRASNGGGIASNGTVTAENVVIENNKTGYDLDTASQVASGSNDRVGGGIYLTGAESSFTGNKVVIIGNKTYGRAGGVFISDGRLELENFIVRDNQTNSNGDINRGRGGGLYGETLSTMILTNGEISGNRAEGHGGGLYQASDGSSIILTNVTVSGNVAGFDPDAGTVVNRASDGGGIHSTQNSTLVLDHVTVVNNRATQNGGGVHRGGGVITYRNSILYGNTRDAENPNLLLSDNNASATIEGLVIIGVNQGGTLNQTSGTRILTNPLLGELADNGGATLPGGFVMQSHTLNPGSVAIDGAVGSVLTEDQRGAARPLGDAADIGAVEVSQPELDTVNFDTTAISEGESVTVTGDILYALTVGETQNGITVEVDWGDGTAVSRMTFDSTHDFTAATPDFSFTHDYGAGVTGSHTATVSISYTGSLVPLDTHAQIITVGDVLELGGTTNENTAVTVTPTGPGVIHTGELTLDDETAIPDLNRLGWSVAIDGDWAVIGSEGQGHREEVYIYHNTVAGWVLEQTLVNDNTDIFDDFGYSVAVDAANGRVFVGAQLDDSGATDKGAVYYYQFNGAAPVGSQWELKQKIQATAAQGSDGSDQFGSSVAISGDVLVIGALLEDADTLAQNDLAGANDSGAAYVFNFNGTTYQFAQKLKAQNTDGSPDIVTSDQFGRSVAIDGTRLVVGAELNDDTGSNSGSAYVYQFNGTQWVIEAKLAASNQGGDDRYGYSVDIAGDIVTIGARQEDSGGSNRGAVYAYDFGGTTVGTVIGSGDTNRVRVTTTNTADPITVSFVNAGASQVLSVLEFNGAVTVNLATDGTGTVTSTAAQVAAILNDLALTSPGGGTISATVASHHSTGTGIVAATAAVPLTQGYELTHLSSASGVPDLADDDRFGGSVAVDVVGGTVRLLTGDYLNESLGGTTNHGRGQLFELNATTGLFELKQVILPSDANGTVTRDEFGLNVAMSGDNYLIGAGRADALYTTNDGAVIELVQWGAGHLFSGAPGEVVEVAKLDGGIADGTNPEFGGAVQFGRRVAIGGDYAVVGATESGKGIDNNTDQRTGRAYLYHREDNGTTDTSDDTWTLVATLAPPTTDDDDGDLFGLGVAISADGSVIAIGANGHEAGGTDQGAVYVYSFDQGTGVVTLEGRLRAANRSNSDDFGRQVTLNDDGSALAVAMRLDDDGDTNSGSVHVYNAAGGDWNTFFAAGTVQQGVQSVDSDGVKLKGLSDATDMESDEFGRSVAISGDRLVIGANDDDFPDDNNAAGSFRDRGSVYVYEFDAAGSHGVLDLDAAGGNGKAQIAVSSTVTSGVSVEIITGGLGAQPTVTENAGLVTIELGIAGNTANEIITAINNATLASNLNATLFTGNGVVNTLFGGNDGSGLVTTASGPQTLTQWQLQQKLIASDASQDDQFGLSVDIDGDTIVVGAYLEDSGGSNAGKAYIFELNSGNPAGSQWEQVQSIQASDRAANDQFGRSVAIDNGIIVVGSHLEDTAGGEAGAVYVFQKDTGAALGSQWGQTDIIRSPYGQSRDQFGISVDISQGNILVGANQQDRILADGTIISNYGGAHAYRIESVVSVTQPVAGGVVTVNGNDIEFDPNGDFEHLAFGESEVVTFTFNNGIEDATVSITVTGVNDAPTFNVGADQTVTAGSGAHSVAGFTSNFDPVEAGQTVLAYLVSNDNAALFSVPPAIDVNGNLTYTLAPNVTGTATVTVRVQDNGGTDDGGIDTSDPLTFDITATTEVSIAATTQASEPGVDGQFTVSLGALSATDTVIDYTVTGTATAGDDYVTLSGTVTILAGQASATIDVSVLNDDLLEIGETVIVTLDSITSGASSISIGATDSATVTIADTDTAVADLSVTTQGEEGTTDLVFTVTLGKVNATGSAITFDIADLGTGSAFTGLDYTAIAPGAQISVANGSATGTFTVVVTNDDLVEATETVTAEITNSSFGAVSIGTASATGDIEDNDVAELSVAATTPASEPGTNGQFTVSLTKASSTDTVVTYLVGGSAIADLDYTALSGTVTILAGQFDATIDVSVIDDLLVEGAEDIIVTLDTITSADPEISIGATDEATMTLSDNDTEVVTTGLFIDGSGVLSIIDFDEGNNGVGSNTKDTLFIGFENGVLVIRDPNNNIGSTVGGSSQVSLHEIHVDPALFTDLLINTGDDDDTITLGSLTGLPGGIEVNGGDGFDQVGLFRSTVALAPGFVADFTAERISLDRSTISVGGAGGINFSASRSGLDGAGLSYTGLDLFASNLNASDSASIFLNGQAGGAGGSGLLIHGGSSINAAGSSGSVTLRGTGGDGAAYSSGVVASYASIAAGSGILFIEGSGGSGGGGGQQGVYLHASSLSQNGSGGSIAISGSGGAGGDSNFGVALDLNVSLTSSGGGGISIAGTGGNGASHNAGVSANRGVALSADGAISIQGTGSGSGFQNAGISLQYFTATTTSASPISLIGLGSNTAAGDSNSGVSLSLSTLSSTGDLIISGIARSGNHYNYGINLYATNLTTVSGAGALSLTGSAAGTGYSNTGVSTTYGSLTSGAGNLSIIGTGGNGNGANMGVSAYATAFQTASGNLSISGQGGAGASGAYNHGVSLLYSSFASSAGGSISFTGTGGGGSWYNHGISLYGTSASTSGPISTNASAGSGSYSWDLVGSLI